MKRLGTGIRIPLICLASLAGLVILVQLVLNVGIVSNYVHRLADENFDGRLDWSSLLVSVVDDFPDVTVLVKDLDVVYPADSSLVNARLDRVKAVVSVWTLLKGNTDAKLDIVSDAVNLNARADISDVFEDDPHFVVNACCNADMHGIKEMLAEEVGVENAAGHIDINLAADIRKSQMSKFNFRNADVMATVEGDCLFVEMPKDTLNVRMFQPYINMFSQPSGFGITANCDSVYLNMGDRTMLRVRDMRNKASVIRAVKNGKSVPRIELNTGNSRAFVRIGSHRISLTDADIDLSLQRRPDFVPLKKIRTKSAVYTRRPVQGNDSTLFPFKRDSIPDYLVEKDFRRNDVSVDVDTAILKFIDDWSPYAHIRIGSGRFASTLLPLRTRLGSLDLNFNDGNVGIDTLQVKCGSTDLSLRGNIRSLFRFIKHRGVLGVDLSIDSKHLNINEIVTAFQHGKEDESTQTVPSEEEYEGFVTDAYRNSDLKVDTVKLLVIPANLKADVHTKVRSARVSFLDIDNFSARAQVGQRTAKLSDVHAKTNIFKLDADAFYSTRTKEKISAGLDAEIGGISATNIMSMIPSVKELMPALKTFRGDLSCNVSVLSDLDTLMVPKLNTAKGLVRIKGQDLSLEADSKIQKYTRMLLFKNRKDIVIDSMYVAASLSDNQVKVYPFILKVDRYCLAIKGIQTLISDCDYHFSVLKSPIPFRFGLNIYGDVSKKVRFRLCKPQFTDENLPLFDSEMDALHSQISSSIRSVLTSGVDNAYRQSGRAVSRLEDRSRELMLQKSEELDGNDSGLVKAVFNDQDTLRLANPYPEPGNDL